LNFNFEKTKNRFPFLESGFYLFGLIYRAAVI